MPSRLDNLFSQAVAEAYANAPSDDVILHTLELRHPGFFDVDGNLTAIRMVADHGVLLQAGDPDVYGHSLKLESDVITAPLNPGEYVSFVACMFNFTLPAQQDGQLPAIDISIDNVAELISDMMDQAVGTRSPIRVTYREYLASDPTQPAFILGGMSLQKVVSNLTRVTGSAVFADLYNRSFPGKLYRPDEYPSLSQ